MQHASHVIHVVDDDSSFRSAIARLLNAAGYGVALYETSQQLLDKHRPGCPIASCSTCSCRTCPACSSRIAFRSLATACRSFS
jgi:hypothetical protein